MICSVCLEKTTISFDKLYSYRVPEFLSGKVFPGSRVLVPFAKGNDPRQGVVFAEIPDDGEGELKYISAVIDNGPVFTRDQLILAEKLKTRLFCTYFDILKAMLPTGMNVKPVKEYAFTSDDGDLSESEGEILRYFKTKKKAKLSQVLTRFAGYDCAEIIDSLVKSGNLSENTNLKRLVGDATNKYVKLIDLTKPLTPKQRKTVEFLRENGETSLKELLYYAAVGKSVVDNLVKLGVVSIYEKEEYRDPYEGAEIKKGNQIKLNNDQQLVFSLLGSKMNGKYNKSLLFGVTGSGKTAVYIKLIEKALRMGKTAMLLVPEISLTPQAVKRLKCIFGDRVAVLHSGLTLAGRLDEWKRIRDKKADVVVGTRSAVLSPLENVGIIVIDEAHESTYISDNPPRYSAVETAELRAKLSGALLLLSSATPSVESYYEAERSGNLYKLTKRYKDANLPEVFVVDLKAERERRGKVISAPLAEEICRNLENNKQSILLLNRRGYNTLITCASCGKTVECPFCSTPMTYHKANGRLICRYCGRMELPPRSCPECGSDYIRYDGAGTQCLEEELSELFPTARVLRMDLDTTLRSMSHEQYIKDFGEGKYEILVGTQMIAKGLDFPNVTLVGVLSADGLFSPSDWKGNHRAFALLTQVVGRSGRGGEKGRAYIQTYDKDNPLIRLASAQDYEAFYRAEIRNRKIMLYPPFCNIWSAVFSSENEPLCESAAKYFLHLMVEKAKKYPSLPLRLLGPATPSVGKISGKYKRKITIKCRNSDEMYAFFKEVIISFYKNKQFLGVSLAVNTNSD